MFRQHDALVKVLLLSGVRYSAEDYNFGENGVIMGNYSFQKKTPKKETLRTSIAGRFDFACQERFDKVTVISPQVGGLLLVSTSSSQTRMEGATQRHGLCLFTTQLLGSGQHGCQRLTTTESSQR